MASLPPGPPQSDQRPPAPPPPSRTTTLGDVLVTLGALLVFAFSFAPFVQWNEGARQELGMSGSVSVQFNAWSPETFMVPLTTFVILATLLAAAGVWVRYALRRDPGVRGFQLRQLEVGLTLFGFVVLLAMVVSKKTIIFGHERFVDAGLVESGQGALDTASGAVLMLLGALIALAGAAMNHLSSALSTSAAGNQPTPTYPSRRDPSQPDQRGHGAES
jgi:hypothetical protein